MPSSSPRNLNAPDPAAPSALPRRADRSVRIVLGIDPGTLLMGYGAVAVTADGPRLVAAGELRQPRKLAVPERLGGLRADLDELLARLDPDVVVVEEAYAHLNQQSALRIAESRGVVLACGAAIGAEIVQLSPSVARKRVVGNGNADKSQVAKMVAVILGVDEIPGTLDVSDALALALAHVHQMDRAERFAPPTEARSAREA